MKRFSFISILIALGLVYATIWLEGGNILSFLSPSCFVSTFGISFVIMLALYNPTDMKRAFMAVAMKNQASREDLLVALAFFSTMQRVMLATGPFGLILGFIHVLEGLGHPDVYAIGEGVAVALISILYSFGGMIFIAIPRIGAAKKKLALLQIG